ncbi:hypothetical protein OHS18_13120 [Amycolatopsis sp. NBC_00355]|uniref:hypothetical protein n=1 Tax=Amycolatopsis sp. NBC_00355 TaxID=2975957 RepID=UPI002E25A6AB
MDLDQPLRVGLDNLENVDAEVLDRPVGHHRADAFDQPGAEVAVDALDRGRQHGGAGVDLELLAVFGVAAPPAFQSQAANTYTYDLADRLASWNNGVSTVAYGYDAAGNRTQVGSSTYTYDARTN